MAKESSKARPWVLLGIVEFILMHFYDLDKKYDQIVADLDARHHASEKQKA